MSQKTKMGIVEIPALYSARKSRSNGDKLFTIWLAAAMSSVGAITVLIPAAIILGNTIGLERVYGDEPVNTILATAVASLLASIQFVTSCVIATLIQTAWHTMWISHAILSTSLGVNILYGFANGMHCNHVVLTFLQFSCINATGCLLLAVYFKFARKEGIKHVNAFSVK